jgi:ADP-ribose pyrophosphatase YjhB (NUDIX family)
MIIIPTLFMPIVDCATKALIVKDGKILVLIDNSVPNKKFIDIPGGRMQHGLTPIENLKREVKEEISIGINVKKIIGTWHFFRFTNNDQTICITYLCEPLSDDINLNNNPDEDEILSEYFWVTPKEFMELESDDPKGFETLKQLVKEYFKLD